MSRKTQNSVFNEDGTKFQITNTESVVGFLTKFSALGGKPAAGNDKYWNNDGFTNPDPVKNLSVQGTAKMLATLIDHAHSLIADGNEEAKTTLAAVLAYEAIAEIAKRKEDKVMADALAAVGPEKLAEFVAKNGLAVQAPEEAKAPEAPIAPVAA